MQQTTNKQTDDTTTAIDKVVMTEEEFCRRVGISRTTAWKMRDEGKLPHFKVGTRVLYSPEHVSQFLAQFEKKATSTGRKRATA